MMLPREARTSATTTTMWTRMTTGTAEGMEFTTIVTARIQILWTTRTIKPAETTTEIFSRVLQKLETRGVVIPQDLQGKTHGEVWNLGMDAGEMTEITQGEICIFHSPIFLNGSIIMNKCKVWCVK